MSDLAQAFARILDRQYYDSKNASSIEAAKNYCVCGDDTALERIEHVSPQWWLSEFGAFLPDDVHEPGGRRLLHALLRLGAHDMVGQWYAALCGRSGEQIEALQACFAEAGCPEDELLLLLAEHCPLLHENAPTAAGRLYLAQTTERLSSLASRSSPHPGRAALTALLVHEDRKRLDRIQPDLLRGRHLSDIARLMVEADFERYRKGIERAAKENELPEERYGLLRLLWHRDPRHYDEEVVQLGRQILTTPSRPVRAMVSMILADLGPRVLDAATVALRAYEEDYEKWSDPSPYVLGSVTETLAEIAEHCGEAARPILLERLEQKSKRIAQAAVRGLMSIGAVEDHERVTAKLRDLLKHADGDSIALTLELMLAFPFADFTEDVWKHTDHKSKPVREALCRQLQGSSDAGDRARQLLASRKATARLSGVEILLAQGDEAAFTTLEAHAEDEDSEEVRDRILLGLQYHWRRQGREITRSDVEKNIERCRAKLAVSPVSWLDLASLPTLRDRTGTPLTGDEVGYLIYRQSRCKEMRADVEAQPLYTLVDRSSSGDFALHVFEGYAKNGADAAQRWALALAALLGDDRLATRLRQAIDAWAAEGRGKLAEYAVQALAMIGTDVALLATDALAIRYRSKYKNIGKAANEALDAAAAMHGIDRDELGDRIVPWLVFAPGSPKIYSAGNRRLELRIGTDFKPVLLDLDKNKRAASLPKAASEADKAEFKDFRSALRDVAKSQLLRVEQLLVRQRRWSTARWQELFLRHPLLRPFAIGLVWGRYQVEDEGEKCTGCFRMLEDGSLTDAHDDEVELGSTARIGIVHPLELDEEALAAWQRHLAEHEVEPPFAQMTRRVLRVADADRAHRAIPRFEGTTLNAMTFRGRAERLGWVRGSVVDAGGVTSYWTSFATAGIDVFLGVENLWVSASVDDQMTIGALYFVRSGSVRTGSYVYDDPGSYDDPRLVPLGEVPPIVYSESVGQLERIAGATLE